MSKKSEAKKIAKSEKSDKRDAKETKRISDAVFIALERNAKISGAIAKAETEEARVAAEKSAPPPPLTARARFVALKLSGHRILAAQLLGDERTAKQILE